MQKEHLNNKIICINQIMINWSHVISFYRLLKEKRHKEEEFVEFCKLRRGAARHTLESLLLLPVSKHFNS